MGNMGPNQTMAVDGLLIDANNAIAGLLEIADDLPPTMRVVPIFVLRRALHGHANIRIRYRTAVINEGNARWHLGRVDTQDVTCGPVQPDMAKITRLVRQLVVVEEQGNAVGGVVALGSNRVVGQERDVRISVAEQWDERLADGAGQPAAMKLLEFHGVGDPTNEIADRANGKLNEHVTAGGRIVMAQHAFALGPDFKPKADEISLGAVYVPGPQVDIEQRVAGIKVT